jgi:hypothetical protein
LGKDTVYRGRDIVHARQQYAAVGINRLRAGGAFGKLETGGACCKLISPAIVTLQIRVNR